MEKRFCIVALGIPLFVGILIILSLYFYDPFLLYHKPYFREEKFSSDMRMQAKGIIKHYDFDSYILGTSMLGNTSAKEAKEKLGGEVGKYFSCRFFFRRQGGGIKLFFA